MKPHTDHCPDVFVCENQDTPRLCEILKKSAIVGSNGGAGWLAAHNEAPQTDGWLKVAIDLPKVVSIELGFVLCLNEDLRARVLELQIVENSRCGLVMREQIAYLDGFVSGLGSRLRFRPPQDGH